MIVAIVPASFLVHIVNVVRVCTDKKVFRTDTGRIIARMAHKKFWVYSSICDFIGEAMGAHGF